MAALAHKPSPWGISCMPALRADTMAWSLQQIARQIYFARNGQMEYQDVVSLLRSEFIPAVGCTEPVAVALTCATAYHAVGGAW